MEFTHSLEDGRLTDERGTKLLDELANKLRLSLGLMDLFPLDLLRGPTEFKPGLLVLGRLDGLKGLLEALVENLEGSAQAQPIRHQRFNLLELMHRSLETFTKSEEAKSCQFSFANNLGQLSGEGDPVLLSAALARFYGFVAALQEFEAQSGVLSFSAKGRELDAAVQLELEVAGLDLSPEGERLLHRPKDLYDSLEPGFLSPMLMHHLICQSFERHGGGMELKARSGGRLTAKIAIGQPARD